MQSLLSNAKLKVLADAVSKAPMGALIEVGVYRGGSLIEIARNAHGRKVFGFDTFNGLPISQFGEGEHHRPGEFAANIMDVKQALITNGITNVSLIPGVFPNTGHVIGSEAIAFAHLDMDFWRGTLDALKFIWPRLTKGGSILFDDYDWKNCPGIAPVVDTWAASHSSILHSGHNQALLVKS